MYQLVKKKKRNVVITIILILVATAAAKELLTVIFSPPPVGQQLDELANSINKRCPLVVDSSTTLLNCSAMVGDRLHFNYRVETDAAKEDLDTIGFKISYREEMINRIKTDPSLAPFKNNAVSLSATFYNQAGTYLCSIGIVPSDLKDKLETSHQ